MFMKKIFSLFVIALFSVSMFADTWTVAGDNATLFGTTWDPADTDNDMELVDGLYTWSVTDVELSAGFNFKVCKNHSWDEAYPTDNYWVNLDFTAVYDVTITFDPSINNITVSTTPHMATLYFVNTNEWADNTVKAYVWRGTSDAYEAWPGEVMTKTAETTINGYPVYSYTFPDIYTKAIFSSDGSVQTEDLEWDADKPYYSYNMGRWYANLYDVPKFYMNLHGNFGDGWADEDPFEESVTAESVSYTVKGLAAGTTYSFGVNISGTWNKLTADITSSNKSAYLTEAQGSSKITTTVAGDYTFTYNYNSNELTVTYPSATALDNTADEAKAVKRIVNGQLVIEREGKLFNALGAEVK